MPDTPRQEIPVDFDAAPWAWGFNTSFETAIGALMESMPHHDAERSLEEINPLRDAVAAAMDSCTAEHRFVLEAHLCEGIAFRPLGERMGLKKSRTHRIYREALDEVRGHLLNQPAVRERLNLITYWNQHARIEVCYIDDLIVEADWLEGLTMNLETVKAAVNNVINGGADVYHESYYIARYLGIAAAYAKARLKELGMWDIETMVELLAWKQSKYGHANILDFGMIGVGMRACDKRARIVNMQGQVDIDPRDESIIDTLRDVIGYAVIARMLNADTFLTELEPF